MDRRAGIIERAAARLREGLNAAEVTPLQPVVITEATRASLTAEALVRSCTLDYVSLARSGICTPWSATRRVAEEIRIIKQNIMARWHTSDDAKTSKGMPRTVMLTSSKPGEGKTFASINLALAFAAEEDLTTVLVDADPMRGDVAKRLNLAPQPGLTEVISGKTRLPEALVQTDLANLIVLPSGAHGPQAPELLSGRGPNVVFADLARRYPKHVMIVDTAPCLASTGPAGLATSVEQIIFVIEAGQTQRQEVEAAVRLLSGCRQISFLLNKAPDSTEHFGSYSYYGALLEKAE